MDCPHCGEVITQADAMEHGGTSHHDEVAILAVLRVFRYPLYGSLIADLSGLPVRTTYHKLHKLEDAGLVERVGQRKGWRLV